MNNNFKYVNVGINLCKTGNINEVIYDCSENSKLKFEGILCITEDELLRIQKSNIDYNITFAELSKKYRNELNNIFSINNNLIKEYNAEKFIKNFINKINKILSKNNFSGSLDNSKEVGYGTLL